MEIAKLEAELGGRAETAGSADRSPFGPIPEPLGPGEIVAVIVRGPIGLPDDDNGMGLSTYPSEAEPTMDSV